MKSKILSVAFALVGGIATLLALAVTCSASGWLIYQPRQPKRLYNKS